MPKSTKELANKDLKMNLAEKYNLVFMPFLLEGVAADPRFNQPDLIHPNQEGVAIMVANLLPHIDRLTHLLSKNNNSIAP